MTVGETIEDKDRRWLERYDQAQVEATAAESEVDFVTSEDAGASSGENLGGETVEFEVDASIEFAETTESVAVMENANEIIEASDSEPSPGNEGESWSAEAEMEAEMNEDAAPPSEPDADL